MLALSVQNLLYSHILFINTEIVQTFLFICTWNLEIRHDGDWNQLAVSWVQWQALVNMVINIHFHKMQAISEQSNVHHVLFHTSQNCYWNLWDVITCCPGAKNAHTLVYFIGFIQGQSLMMLSVQDTFQQAKQMNMWHKLKNLFMKTYMSLSVTCYWGVSRWDHTKAFYARS